MRRDSIGSIRASPPIAGFAIACLAFLASAFVSDFASLAVLHFAGGAAIGCALSFTHGTIAHSANPHRLFAIVGMALGVFAIVFLGATPNLIAAFGGPALFRTFALVMAVAAIAAIRIPDGDGAQPTRTWSTKSLICVRRSGLGLWASAAWR